jgi:hypothetical protein
MSDASLWSKIRVNIANPQALESTTAYINRSKEAWLSLDISAEPSISADETVPWVQFLNHHSSRIRSFSLSDDKGPMFLELSQELYLPVVESLVLRGDSESAPELPQIFHRDLPHLRHLSLFQFSLWPRDIFTNLVTLRLSNHGHEMSISTFLDVLDESPLLQELELERYEPVDSQLSPLNRVSSLHYLSKLQLQSCNALRILSHLHLSPIITIRLDNTLDFMYGGTWRRYFYFFQNIPEDLVVLGISPPGSAHSLDLHFSNEDLLHLSIQDVRYPHRPYVLHVDQCFSGRLVSKLVENLLMSLRGSRICPSVTQLSIRSVTPVYSNFKNVTVVACITSLSKYPNLEHLILHEIIPQDIFIALASRDYSNHSESVQVLPRLLSLEVKMHASQNVSATAASLLERIIQVVVQRNHDGFPIRQLSIELWCSKDTGNYIYQLPLNIDTRLLDLTKHGVEKLQFIQDERIVLQYGMELSYATKGYLLQTAGDL